MVTCVSCGRPAEETHHVKPVSRRPDLARHDTNKVPVCRDCHANMTAYRWRIERRGGFWYVLNTRTGELLSRRYAAPMGAALATPASELGRVLAREGQHLLLQKLAMESDENLLIADKYFGTLSRAASWARALVRHEAYMRWPYKEGTCEHHASQAIHDLAKAFGCSEKAIYEDVRAAELYAGDDTGPLMPASWYRAASHAPDPQKALTIARALHDQGGTIVALRQRLGLMSGAQKKHACPLCGHVHVVRYTPQGTLL